MLPYAYLVTTSPPTVVCAFVALVVHISHRWSDAWDETNSTDGVYRARVLESAAPVFLTEKNSNSIIIIFSQLGGFEQKRIQIR
jgi:hypothetical protein